MFPWWMQRQYPCPAMKHRSKFNCWRGGVVSAAGVLAACSLVVAQDSRAPATPPPAPSPEPVAGPPVEPPAPVMPTRVPFTPISAVKTQGTGPVHIVLLSEVFCESSIWQEFMDRNADRFTMHAISLPGMDGSPAPEVPPDDSKVSDRPWTHNAVEAVAAWIREKKIDRPILVGHSVGGMLAIEVAAKAPELVREVVSIDGLPAIFLNGPSGKVHTPRERADMVDGQIGKSIRQMGPEGWKEHWSFTESGTTQDQPRSKVISAMMGNAPHQPSAQYMAEALAADLHETARNLKVPITFFGAIPDQDQFYGTRRDLRRVWLSLPRQVPQARVVLFEDSRRFVMVEAPRELDEALADIAAGKPPSGRLPVFQVFGPSLDLGLPRISGEAPPVPKEVPTLRPPPPNIRPGQVKPDSITPESGGGAPNEQPSTPPR